MMREIKTFEMPSLGPGGISFGSGLLGATSSTVEGMANARLEEIERRILAIEAKLAAVA